MHPSFPRIRGGSRLPQGMRIIRSIVGLSRECLRPSSCLPAATLPAAGRVPFPVFTQQCTEILADVADAPCRHLAGLKALWRKLLGLDYSRSMKPFLIAL